MTKTEQLRKLIETVVRKEVRALLPQLVKEVMANMILESHTPTISDDGYDNSSKRRQLMENSAPASMRASTSMRELVGWDEEDGPPTMGESVVPNKGGKINYVTEYINEAGHPIPIDPTRIPENVLEAMNKDYRGLMSTWKKK